MTFATVSKSLVMGVALLLASSAFAGTKGTLQLNSPVKVNGTQLKPGDYKVEWEGTGPNVEMSILRGKDVVAKVPAHVVELPTAASNTAAVTHDNGNGEKSLAGVRFQGKKIGLDLDQSTDSMQTGGSSK